MSSQYIHVLSIHIFLLTEEVFSKEFWLVSNMSLDVIQSCYV